MTTTATATAKPEMFPQWQAIDLGSYRCVATLCRPTRAQMLQVQEVLQRRYNMLPSECRWLKGTKANGAKGFQMLFVNAGAMDALTAYLRDELTQMMESLATFWIFTR